MTDAQYQPAVELYVRSMCPRGAHQRQERVLKRLEAMDEDGDIELIGVVVWGERIGPETVAGRTERGRRILDRIAEFEDWAATEGVSLPWFDRTQDVENPVTESPFAAITLPVMCLAEYVDGEPVHVAPHADGDDVQCIEDRLEAIATRSGTAREENHREATPL